MHTRLKLAAIAVVALAALTLVPVAGPATAAPGDTPSRGGDMTPTDRGLLGRVWSQVNELNRYARQPVPCNDEEPELAGSIRDPNAGNGRVDVQGFRRWRLVGGDQAVWHAVNGTSTGMYYALECYGPNMPDAGEGYEDVGYLYEIRLFPDINPENLARLALDQFFLGLPAPEPRLNPEGTTLVNLETYLWVDNIREQGLTPPGLRSEVISVPGIRVQGFALATGVEWDMGDGTLPFVCEGTVRTEPPSCAHQYIRSSAEQPDDVFRGTATIVWLGTYTVNGTLADDEFEIPLETSFEIEVAESQAVVVNGN
jgi:hypothetical protein